MTANVNAPAALSNPVTKTYKLLLRLDPETVISLCSPHESSLPVTQDGFPPMQLVSSHTWILVSNAEPHKEKVTLLKHSKVSSNLGIVENDLNLRFF